MSEPLDDQDLNEYLSRRSDLSLRYREIAVDELPTEVSERVLGQARVAVKPRLASQWKKWTAPLALAASFVLVVSIVIESGGPSQMSSRVVPSSKSAAPARAESITADRASPLLANEINVQAPRIEQPASVAIVPKPVVADVRPRPPPAPAPRSPVTMQSAPESVVVEARSRSEAMQQTPIAITTVDADASSNAPARDAVAAQASGSVAEERAANSSSEAGTGLSEITVTAAIRRSPSAPGAGPRGTVPASGNEAKQAKAERDLLREEPKLWLNHIRELRAQGKARDANREWRDFQKQYPEYPVAQDDAARGLVSPPP